MGKTKELTIHGYPHDGPRDSGGRVKGKREPLVHLLASNDWGGVDSITFHPDHADAIGKAIIEMGRSVAKGGRQKKVSFALRGGQ